MLGITIKDKIRNIRARTKMEDMTRKAEKDRARWAGYDARMDVN